MLKALNSKISSIMCDTLVPALTSTNLLPQTSLNVATRSPELTQLAVADSKEKKVQSRKLALVGIIPIKFSSLSAPTKYVGAEREENLIGMIPTRASLRLNGSKSSELSLVAACL